MRALSAAALNRAGLGPLRAEVSGAELRRAGLGQVEVAISPYGVRLKGVRDEAERRKALRAIWPAILGPLRLD